MTISIEATKAYEREKTGVGWYSFYIIQELAELIKSPHKLRLYINSSAKIQNSKFKIQNYSSKFKINELHWPLKYFWTQGRLSIEMIINPPDVLFIPAHLPPLIHPKKLVVTIHDLAFKQYPEVYSAKELRLQEWGIKSVLKRAWRIITPSEFTKSEIYRWYPWFKKDNIFVVPHGICQNQKSKIKNQNDKSKCKNILYIGRLEHKKNVVNLIKAFNILSHWKLEIGNWKLVLIGPPGYGYEEIKREINAPPYKEHIKETGWLPREAVTEYLANAALFIFPSLYEGFGMPLLESFAAGTPVVASDIPALQEVGADVPLYANPDDPKSIADAAYTLLTNDSLRAQKIRDGFRHVEKYSWREAAKRTLEILTTTQHRPLQRQSLSFHLF